jgi:8-oxo-dGTP diphosphatase
MTYPDVGLAARFPRLYRREKWKWTAAHVTFSAAPPDETLVTNIHVVGFVDDAVVVCRAAKGSWFLPGGTREPGESIDECVARELVEEAGARLVSPLRWIGAHYVLGYRARSTRPRNPHPLRAILWCAAELSIDGSPTNPADGEQVVEVRVAPLAEAQRLLATGSAWYADLLTLAAELHHSPAH